MRRLNRRRSGPYERVLLPVDMSHASADAIRTAHRLGLLDGPDVFVVHAGCDGGPVAAMLTIRLKIQPVFHGYPTSD